MRVQVKLLGGLQIYLPAGVPIPLPKKAEALLVFLACHLDKPLMRDNLAALLWGESDDQHARNSLRQTLYMLRKVLSKAHQPLFILDGETIALNPESVELDVLSFEHLISEGSPESLEEAVAMHHGDFLAGLAITEGPFEEWLLIERERYRELALEALAKLLAHQMKNVSTEAAIQTALRLLALDPLQEAVYRSLMRLYMRQNRWASAQRLYHVCAEKLKGELGVAPEAQTTQLYEQILTIRQKSNNGENPATTPPAVAETDRVETVGERKRNSRLEVLTLLGAFSAASRRITVSGGLMLGVAIISLFYFWPVEAQPEPDDPPRKLAVLPFHVAEAYSYEQDLGVQMADAIITRLSKSPGLEVRSTSAVTEYRAEMVPLEEVGSHLNVDGVLEGRIQMLGNRMIVRVQLVRVRDSSPIWAHQFDEKIIDMLTVQNSVADRIVSELRNTFPGI